MQANFRRQSNTGCFHNKLNSVQNGLIKVLINMSVSVAVWYDVGLKIRKWPAH